MRAITIIVALGLAWGCGSSPLRPTAFTESPGGRAAATLPTITSISPDRAIAGTAALTLTVTGTNFVASSVGTNSIPQISWVRWSADGVTTDLWETRVVSATELSVLIPASLLAKSATASVLVANGDPMAVGDGFVGYPKSNSVGFVIADPLSAQN